MTIAPNRVTTLTTVSHPLEPLTPEEITAAVTILRQEKSLGIQVRFATVTLNEPAKTVVLSFKPGMAIIREAFIILLDNATAQTYEAVVDLGEGVIRRWEHIPGVQPPIMLDEFAECEAAVKADPAFQAAIAKRGITDPDLVMVD
ncbi:MAG: tyramine oxidase, partial [Leptolyngbyaceae cyanobacterium SM2_3_12]|nr:tyramine oxidase [Leptolyngbyaceae cyanobacterium SM2_3_12]